MARRRRQRGAALAAAALLLGTLAACGDDGDDDDPGGTGADVTADDRDDERDDRDDGNDDDDDTDEQAIRAVLDRVVADLVAQGFEAEADDPGVLEGGDDTDDAFDDDDGPDDGPCADLERIFEDGEFDGVEGEEAALSRGSVFEDEPVVFVVLQAGIAREERALDPLFDAIADDRFLTCMEEELAFGVAGTEVERLPADTVGDRSDGATLSGVDDDGDLGPMPMVAELEVASAGRAVGMILVVALGTDDTGVDRGEVLEQLVGDLADAID